MFQDTDSRNVVIRGLRMAEIADAISGMPGLTPVERDFALRSYIRACADDLSAIDKSPHTIKNLFTAARKCIPMDSTVDGQVLKIIKQDFTVAGAVMAEIKARAEVRRVGNSINVATYDNVPVYLDTIEKYLTSGIENLVLVGMLAATGRRPIELRRSNFEFLLDSPDTTQKSKMMFSGQAKTRDNTTGEYPIPVLADAGLIMDQLEKFGSALARVSVKAANAAFASFADEVVWPDTVKPGAKNVRAMYACITYAMLCPDNMQEWCWVNGVLGHEEYDQVTCQAYMRFKVKYDANA